MRSIAEKAIAYDRKYSVSVAGKEGEESGSSPDPSLQFTNWRSGLDYSKMNILNLTIENRTRQGPQSQLSLPRYMSREGKNEKNSVVSNFDVLQASVSQLMVQENNFEIEMSATKFLKELGKTRKIEQVSNGFDTVLYSRK